MIYENAARQDYRMPAEWETHEGAWLQWPQEKLHRGYELKLEGMWLTMVDALHTHENVHLYQPTNLLTQGDESDIQ